MIRVKTAFVAGLFLVIADPLPADQWFSPSPLQLRSPNGVYRVRVTPGESIGDLFGFKGARKGKYAQATLTGPGGERHVFTLLNPVAPVDAVLFDDGTLLTFDNWHNMGYGAALAAYSKSGAVLWSCKLEEIVPAAVLEKVPTSVSSRWWRKEPFQWVGEDEAGERWIAITLWNEDRLRVRLRDGRIRYAAAGSAVRPTPSEG